MQYMIQIAWKLECTEMPENDGFDIQQVVKEASDIQQSVLLV